MNEMSRAKGHSRHPDSSDWPDGGKSFAKKSVFISHKSRDKEAAQDIRRLLMIPGGDSLHVFISERIEAGQEWSRQIRENLERADYLLLLYTDPTEEWDWCLFEAGFFVGRAKEKHNGMICLHSTKHVPPKPLQQFQSIRVDEKDKLVDFLRKLFTGINRSLIESQEDIQNLADNVVKVLVEKTVKLEKSILKTDYITLHLGPSEVKGLQEAKRIPETVVCESQETESLKIFGLLRGECTMRSLDGGLEGHYKESWLKGLAETLSAASMKKDPVPPIPILYSKAKKREYHVILHRIDLFTDGSIKFFLLFIEKIREVEDKDENVRMIGDMLTLGRKLRWKILMKFHREISVLRFRTHNERERRECLDSLRLAMNWVAGEATRLDLLIPEDVINAFEEPEDRKRIEEIVTQRWPGLADKLFRGMEIEKPDLDLVLGAIEGLLELNKEYMVVSAKRYQELLAKM